jgi:hypothetical protein
MGVAASFPSSGGAPSSQTPPCRDPRQGRRNGRAGLPLQAARAGPPVWPRPRTRAEGRVPCRPGSGGSASAARLLDEHPQRRVHSARAPIPSSLPSWWSWRLAPSAPHPGPCGSGTSAMRWHRAAAAGTSGGSTEALWEVFVGGKGSPARSASTPYQPLDPSRLHQSLNPQTVVDGRTGRTETHPRLTIPSPSEVCEVLTSQTCVTGRGRSGRLIGPIGSDRWGNGKCER